MPKRAYKRLAAGGKVAGKLRQGLTTFEDPPDRGAVPFGRLIACAFVYPRSRSTLVAPQAPVTLNPLSGASLRSDPGNLPLTKIKGCNSDPVSSGELNGGKRSHALPSPYRSARTFHPRRLRIAFDGWFAGSFVRATGTPGRLLSARTQLGISGQLPVLDLRPVHGYCIRYIRLLQHQSDLCFRAATKTIALM